MSDLVHLHVHSEFSILDGCGKQSDFIARAKELALPAVCFTEHGSLRGIHKLYEASNEVGIKPIYGIEFYACHDHQARGLPRYELEAIRNNGTSKVAQNKLIKQREEELGTRKRFHVTALAKNNQGLKNLYKLSSEAWLNGFYFRPRIDFELLERFGDGLIILSGCIEGFANQAILKNDFDLALEYITRFRERWDSDFYLEIMPNRLGSQQKVNAILAQIHRKLKIPLVATVDAHYINKEDARAHDVLLCVNTKQKLDDPYRWSFGCQDFWYQTRKEMIQGFKQFHPALTGKEIRQALDQTVLIADQCAASLEVDKFRALVPQPDAPQKSLKGEFQYLTDLCLQGWDSRDIPKRAGKLAKHWSQSEASLLEVYTKRLKTELKQIKAQKVGNYFLAIADLQSWARNRGIVCGPGRGSAGGSLVSFLTGITDIDPIEHRLLFERFLNPSRIDIPDIDLDYEDRRRGEVVDYLRGKYGDDKVCQISTTSRMNGKACLRDVARVLDIPPWEVNPVAELVTPNILGKEVTDAVEDALTKTPLGKAFADRHPEVLRYVKRLEGQVRSIGLHAAGVVVSRDKLTDWIPLETRQSQGKRVACSGVDMHGVEAQGLLKIDVLGLRTLSIVADCLQAIKARHRKKIDLNQIELNDPLVLRNFTQGNLTGIFQFDTSSAAKLCAGVTFESFDVIPAMVALDRPGTAQSGLAEEYLKRKANPKRHKSIHPIIEKICEDTLGVIVFQEHAIKIFTEVGGFSPAKADSLRKAIGKKIEGVIEKERQAFIEGALKRGLKRGLAESVFDKLILFGGYVFNRSHSVAYGLIAYRQMWLKTYYPLEFYWALLKNEPDQQRIGKFTREAKRLGIDILPPHVNESKATFAIVGKAIRVGLLDLKGVGSKAVVSIEREQPFADFIDFIERADPRHVHKGVIAALVKAGAMTSLIDNPKWFLENLEDIWKRRNRSDWKEWVSKQLAASESLPHYDADQLTLAAIEVSPLALGRHPIEPYLGLLETAPVYWQTLKGEEIWQHEQVWLRGTLTEIKNQQIGHFHHGKELTEAEKRRKKFGARFAVVQLEDESGESKRVKIGTDVFHVVSPVLQKGVGVPVAIFARVQKQWRTIRAQLLIDLMELKKQIEASEPLDPYKNLLMAPRKLFKGHKRKDLIRRLRVAKFGSSISGVAFVVSVEERFDKRDREMAFACLAGIDRALAMVCFASAWPEVKPALKPGALVRAVVKAEQNSYFIEKAQLIKENCADTETDFVSTKQAKGA